MKARFCILITALALLVLSLAGGAVRAAEKDLYHLGEVVFTGQEPVVEAVGVTRRVTAEEIKERDARTLDQAINLLPGVNVRVGGDGKPRIDIHGLRTRQIKLLLNGTPFNSTFDGQFDPSLISVENIAEIVVTTGASSVLYGSGGNAGIINIITKKGTKGTHGSANGEVAEGDAQLLRATGSYGADKYDIFISGSHYDRDHFNLSDDFSPTASEDGGARENSDQIRNNVFANIGFSPTDATLLGLTFSYLNGEQGKPPAIVNDDYTNQKFEREDDTEEYNVQFALHHDFNGPLSFRGWTYFNNLDVLENGYDNNTYSTQNANGAFRTDSTTEISGFNGQLRYDLHQLGDVTLGFMVENDDYQASGFEISKKGTDITDINKDLQLYSASLQYEVSPLQKLGIVLGLGYNWQDRDEKDEDDFTYLAGLYYDLSKATRLKASHSRKIRFPTLRDLYEPKRANPDLTAETSLNYEAGIEQRLPAATSASLTGFYTDIKDYIEKPKDEDMAQNREKYEIYGMEVVAENHWIDKLFLRASYTYLHTKDKSAGSQRDQLQNDPEHKVTMEATYQAPWGLNIYGSALWVANSYYYDRQTESIKKKLPDYWLFDFKINKQVAKALDLYFGINNAFDEDYQQSYGFPQAGRTMYGGATWRF